MQLVIKDRRLSSISVQHGRLNIIADTQKIRHKAGLSSSEKTLYKQLKTREGWSVYTQICAVLLLIQKLSRLI